VAEDILQFGDFLHGRKEKLAEKVLFETFEKSSILFKVKDDDPALAGLTTDIHGVFRGLKFESDAKI
jgi:hypothetical protein